MGANFSKIKAGQLFSTTEGDTFRKTSELTFDDMAGIEHYIGSEPFLDAKIIAETVTPLEGTIPDLKKQIAKLNSQVNKLQKIKATKTKSAKKSSKKKSVKKKR